MLKDRLIERLNKTKEQKIKVVWNAGGDETIVNFFTGDKTIRYYEDTTLIDLRDYLIQEFNLPNAGEYYNEGGGEITLVEDERILFVYDEFAYGDDYEAELEDSNELDEFSIPINLLAQNLLEKLNLTKLSFYGSTSFLAEEKDEFNVSSRSMDYRKSKEKLSTLQTYIKKEVLAKLSPPFEAMEIQYSGIIKEDEILVEEVRKLKYFIDKNKKQEKVYLFEKGGHSWLDSVFGKK